MKIRIAAVTLSIAAIITAGVVNTATAGTGPMPVIDCSNSQAGCAGAPIVTQPAPAAPEAPQTAEPAPQEAPAAATGETKPAAPKPAPQVVEPAPAVVESAPVVKTAPKSGCN